MYSAVLVDDEYAAHYAMESLFKSQKRITLVGQAHNGKQAIETINRLRPDLVFLDIQMPDMTGFEVLEQLAYQPYIIFCTAYEQYAIEAFNQNSIDYLLKPIEKSRFIHCLDKIDRLLSRHKGLDLLKIQELSNLFYPPKKATAIPINIQSRIYFVQCEKIIYCVAKDGYVSLMTDDGKEHVSDLTLKDLEEKLPSYFLRVQKSHIVNKDKIEEIQKYFNNRLILKMKNNIKITTGTSYIQTIREELQL